MKDLSAPERLFQLSGYGLPAKFAPLKTLGASSSLPVPPTVLVGRDSELAELTALLGSSHVRLVTLTGSGGSGKTRLGIGLARRLTRQFPDGVYFVSLAAVTTAEVMWTTIAEELDLPPEGRIPPGFFTHVAHRSASSEARVEPGRRSRVVLRSHPSGLRVPPGRLPGECGDPPSLESKLRITAMEVVLDR